MPIALNNLLDDFYSVRRLPFFLKSYLAWFCVFNGWSTCDEVTIGTNDLAKVLNIFELFYTSHRLLAELNFLRASSCKNHVIERSRSAAAQRSS